MVQLHMFIVYIIVYIIIYIYIIHKIIDILMITITSYPSDTRLLGWQQPAGDVDTFQIL